MPSVSIVIPTFNRENFVVNAIDSVLKQSFRDYEIIVVDDGSTDRTRKVLESYGERIKYIYQENSGVSSARNTGIRAAKGEWIAFLDSDDEWTEDYLAVHVAQIREFPRAVGHIANACTVLPNGERADHFRETGLSGCFKGKNRLVLEKPLSTIIRHVPWFLQSTILHGNTLASSGLFDVGLSIAEDLDVISRVAARGPFTFSGRALVKIFRREEKIENLGARSRKNKVQHYLSFCKVYRNLLGYRNLTLSERASLSRALSMDLRALGNFLVSECRILEARGVYRESVLCYPSLRSLIKFLATFLPASASHALLR